VETMRKERSLMHRRVSAENFVGVQNPRRRSFQLALQERKENKVACMVDALQPENFKSL
jgi:hypothetical protein